MQAGGVGGPRGSAAAALLLPTLRFQKTLFTLALRAAPDSLRLVVNVATGAIVSASVPPFALASGAGALAVAGDFSAGLTPVATG
jgi:hypothetical protein